MLGEVLFDSQHLHLMKRALQTYALRHRVVADNLANIETVGYDARKVDFESALEGFGDSSSGLKSVAGHEGHLPLGRPDVPPAPEVNAVDEGFDNGVNDVNVDREMAEMVKNDLAYRLATRLLGRRYQGMRTAIIGQNR